MAKTKEEKHDYVNKCKKSFGNILYLFTIKSHKMLGTDENFLNLIKG